MTVSTKNAAGIKDVAEHAGVAISTVSNVLNGTKPVSPPLRERVLAAVRETGYQANPVARGLKSGRTSALSVIVPSITSVFFPVALRGMQLAAARGGYSLSIYETQEDFSIERRCVRQIKNQRADGLIIATCADADADAYFEELAGLEINGKRIPAVGLESSPGGRLDAIVVDNRSAAADMTEYLIALGRARIAHISGPMRYEMSRARRAGYFDALVRAGRAVDERLILESDFTPLGGYRCMRALLDSGTLVDAVVCGNDQTAVGCIRAITERGLRIPQEIAVTGFDNSFPGTLIAPALTTVAVPRQRMGEEAVALLLERIHAGRNEPVRIRTMETRRVVRQSTDANALSRWELEGW